MQSAEVQIVNKLGLHARPATKLVKVASTGKSQVFLTKDGQRVNARSILGVMLLQAEYGSRVLIEVEGEDEQAVLQELLALFQSRFGED